jgi:Flp pilus assembly protein TadG
VRLKRQVALKFLGSAIVSVKSNQLGSSYLLRDGPLRKKPALFSGALALCARLLKDRAGAVAALAAVALPVVIGAAGLGTDVAFWYLAKRNMQGAADVGAVNAAVALGAGNTTAYASEALAAAAQRGFVNGTNNVTVNVYSPLSADPNANHNDPYYGVSNTVEVVISQTQSPLMSALVGNGNVNIGARSVAQYSNQTYCMLALNNTSTTGVLLNLFFSVLNMPNCSIGDNATGGNALKTQGFLWAINAFTATVGGAINNGCFFCNLNWTQPARTNAGAPIVPILDPYSPTGSTPRTMPTPATVTAINPLAASLLTFTPTPTNPPKSGAGDCIVTLTSGKPPGCYLGPTTAITSAWTLGAGTYTIVAPTTTKPAISVGTGGSLTTSSSTTLTVLGVAQATPGNAASSFVTTNQPAVTISGGSISFGGTTTISGGTTGINMTGGTVTIAATALPKILGQGTGAGVSVSGGTFTLAGGTTSTGIIQGGTTSGIGIAVSGTGTVTIGTVGTATTNRILGQGTGVGISVGGGTLTMAGNTTNTIVSTGASGILVAGGTLTIGSASATPNSSVLGAAGVAISLTGGTVTINGNSTNNFQSVSSTALSVSGGTMTIGGAGVTATNKILAQASSQSAISVSGGTLTLGGGTSTIQGSVLTPGVPVVVTGTGNFVTLDGITAIIGPSAPTVAAITSATSSANCGFGFGGCSGKDLSLGAGTYTLMCGLSVTGGNLTLNPNGTSIGTYILYGNIINCSGTNAGFCMTFGDFNGTNSTIVLTGNGTSGYATFQNGVPNGPTADGFNLTAPTTGATAGIAVFQDRNATTTGFTNGMAGANFLNVTGALYFPEQQLNFIGLTLGNLQPANGNACMQMIANTIQIQGLAFVDDQCAGTGVTPIVSAGSGSVVE